ncbi:MAG: threonylcarbamoyl-AMP synthase [Anaerolineales bacterium]|nr:threonylcarbamoyl-AMP synthase [Anaerolineales bacterium]
MTVVMPASDPNTVTVAAEFLTAGQLIVMPTDTVYGVAARLSDDAILRLYLAKERPPDKAIPILLSSVDDVEQVAQPMPSYLRAMAQRFWPGPLTLVLPKRDGLPQRVSALPTVGVRVPDNATAQAIIRAAGGALAVTSANRSGQPAARTVQEAIEQLGDSIALAIDGGRCELEIASTVAAIEGRTVRVVREGPITEAMLQAAIRAED